MTKLSKASGLQWTNCLAELGVHVNNEGEYPVFSLGVKETAATILLRLLLEQPF
jgi:hypothetical protein